MVNTMNGNKVSDKMVSKDGSLNISRVWVLPRPVSLKNILQIRKLLILFILVKTAMIVLTKCLIKNVQMIAKHGWKIMINLPI